MKLNISIQALNESHEKTWFALWKGYQAFYQTEISAEVTLNTWTKLCQAQYAHMYGFVAEIDAK